MSLRNAMPMVAPVSKGLGLVRTLARRVYPPDAETVIKMDRSMSGVEATIKWAQLMHLIAKYRLTIWNPEPFQRTVTLKGRPRNVALFEAEFNRLRSIRRV